MTIVLAISFIMLFFNRIGDMNVTFLGIEFNSAFFTLVIGIPTWIIGAAVGFYRPILVKELLN